MTALLTLARSLWEVVSVIIPVLVEVAYKILGASMR
jgi:hypothetical protein